MGELSSTSSYILITLHIDGNWPGKYGCVSQLSSHSKRSLDMLRTAIISQSIHETPKSRNLSSAMAIKVSDLLNPTITNGVAYLFFPGSLIKRRPKQGHVKFKPARCAGLRRSIRITTLEISNPATDGTF